MPDCLFAYCLPARVALGIMGFLMFLVTQMIRVNLYIAMVSINELKMSNSSSQVNDDWDANASGLLLSSFYWSYWATELPGGLLAQRFGGRRVLGLSVTLAGALNLLIPFAIHWHYLLAAAIRVLQGLSLGVTWPAMHWLSARWIPSTERSKFMSVYHGAAVGTAITYPLSGIIILHLGWSWVFYGTGVITLAWSAAWWLYVYDSPKSHPRIKSRELEYLEEKIGNSVSSQRDKISTPWWEILHSAPFWGVLMASQGLMWGTITLSMQTPPYFKQVHHLDIKTIGYYSGVPEVCKFVFSIFYSSLTDKFLKDKLLSITIARKLAVAVCELLPAVLLTFLALYGGENKIVALTLLALTSAVGGASSSGSLANIVDLSPNFAGTILGLIKTLTIIPGVVSPLIVTHLTRVGVNPKDGWRNALLITAFVYGLCCVSFQICGSGKVQSWNYTKQQKADKNVDVMIPLTVKGSVERLELEQNSLNSVPR